MSTGQGIALDIGRLGFFEFYYHVPFFVVILEDVSVAQGGVNG